MKAVKKGENGIIFCPHLFAAVINSDCITKRTKGFVFEHYTNSNGSFEELVDYYSSCLDGEVKEGSEDFYVTELYRIHSLMKCKPNCGCYKSCSHREG